MDNEFTNKLESGTGGNGKTKDDEDEGIEVRVLNALQAGQSPFNAWTRSKLLVKQGKKKVIWEVPIKSVGVSEIMEQIAHNAPTPPKKIRVVKKDSPEGRAAGYTHDQMAYVENLYDEDYMRERDAYNVHSTYLLVLKGLAMDVFDSDGKTYLVKANDTHTATEIINEDKAILVLKQSGLTNEHILKLQNDITALTRYEEEKLESD